MVGITDFPVKFVDRGTGFCFLEVCNGKIVSGNGSDFAIIEVDDAFCITGDGSGITSDDIFLVTDTDQNGGTFTGYDEFTRETGTHNGNSISSFDVEEGFTDDFSERKILFFLVVVIDKVNEGFGIGIGGEDVIFISEEKF